MVSPNMIIFYVDDAERSAAFYTELLQRGPVDSQATFALFVFDNGLKLGLWSRSGVQPSAEAKAGGSELGIAAQSHAEVLRLHRDWQQHGVEIVQAPTQMDFGYTFTALDPDGHRLRVFCLG
ncbi:catechol 2,3-dioxygenase-like lactoylglutathione lyase family enzyme [Pseudomonas nitritireducens]|uniref:Catechol 2,3-dioxygenase-like lactoylglutathione lyase family enzyme n=1 Tax=Pseudomonas nitroreducens TaxID=46680 RepID=A0A7W7KQY9_PSENT|nr:VOC family protein [Pseudomonas nitritireducens]MBB4866949.1 catechol 2,3-dioxygenase-like lactoylglutathione lyase family enzyme [Pseudomonas nitritireducens]